MMYSPEQIEKKQNEAKEVLEKIIITSDPIYLKSKDDIYADLSDIDTFYDKSEYLNSIKKELLVEQIAYGEFVHRNSTPAERINLIDMTEGYLIHLLEFIEELLLPYNKIIELENRHHLSPINKKIKWNGSPSLFGYLFFELADKGHFNFPLHNGEINPTGLAKQLYEMFEIGTTKENLIKEFNPNKNSLSLTKRQKFQIPELADLS